MKQSEAICTTSSFRVQAAVEDAGFAQAGDESIYGNRRGRDLLNEGADTKKTLVRI
jgi:hypothetical protein